MVCKKYCNNFLIYSYLVCFHQHWLDVMLNKWLEILDICGISWLSWYSCPCRLHCTPTHSHNYSITFLWHQHKLYYTILHNTSVLLQIMLFITNMIYLRLPLRPWHEVEPPWRLQHIAYWVLTVSVNCCRTKEQRNIYTIQVYLNFGEQLERL